MLETDDIDVRLSPEIANLFLMAILCLLSCWLIRLARLLFSLTELRISLLNGQLMRLEASDELYNELDVLTPTHFQHLLRTRSSVSADVGNMKVPFAVKSVSLADGVENPGKFCELTYDCITSAVIGVYWGVDLDRFNERCRYSFFHFSHFFFELVLRFSLSRNLERNSSENIRFISPSKARSVTGSRGENAEFEMADLRKRRGGSAVASRATLVEKGEDDGSPAFFNENECFLEGESVVSSFGMGMKLPIVIPEVCAPLLARESAPLSPNEVHQCCAAARAYFFLLTHVFRSFLPSMMMMKVNTKTWRVSWRTEQMYTTLLCFGFLKYFFLCTTEHTPFSWTSFGYG